MIQQESERASYTRGFDEIQNWVCIIEHDLAEKLKTSEQTASALSLVCDAYPQHKQFVADWFYFLQFTRVVKELAESGEDVGIPIDYLDFSKFKHEVIDKLTG